MTSADFSLKQEVNTYCQINLGPQDSRKHNASSFFFCLFWKMLLQPADSNWNLSRWIYDTCNPKFLEPVQCPQTGSHSGRRPSQGPSSASAADRQSVSFRSLRLKRCVCSLCRLWPCTPRWGSPAPPRSSTPRRWSTSMAPPSSAPSPRNSREPWRHQGSCFTDTDRKSQHTIKTTLNPAVPEEPWSR